MSSMYSCQPLWIVPSAKYEQAFRFNNRGNKEKPMTDADRFSKALSQIVEKRLAFAEVTGKLGETSF